MIDISKQRVDINCSECNAKVTITMGQVSKQETVSCNKCRQKIKLVDSNGSARKGVSDMNKALDKLNRTLKGFGR